MQGKVGECVSERQLHGFGHITVSGITREKLIAEIRILKCFAKDLTEINRSDDRRVFQPTNKKIFVRILCGIDEHSLEVLGGKFRPRIPMKMPATLTIKVHQSIPVMRP